MTEPTMRERTQEVSSSTSRSPVYFLDKENQDGPFARQDLSSGKPSILLGVDHTREMHDVVTPEYHQKSASGEIINNPMDSEVEMIHQGHLFLSQEIYAELKTDPTGWFRDLRVGEIPIQGFPYLPTVNDLNHNLTRLKNLALSRTFAKVQRSELQSIVTIAEAKKTYDFIVESMSFIGSVLKAILTRSVRSFNFVRQGKVLSRKRFYVHCADKASNLWLGYRYGLRPLVYEIVQAVEAYNALGKHTRTSLRSQVSDSHYESTLGTANSEFWPGSSLQLETYHKSIADVSAGALLEVTRPTIDVSTAFGFTEIVSSAWELVPFSFVIDWFLNTADWFASWDPKFGVDVLASWYTTKVTDIQRTYVANFGTDWGSSYFNHEDLNYTSSPVVKQGTTDHVVINIAKSRVPDPHRPLLPSLSIRLNGSKLVDLLALGYKLKRSR